MQEYFQKNNIELEESEIKQFEKFLEIFKEKNSQINLSAIREDQDIIEKHFVDSVMLNVFVDLHGKVADLGTGGGFPMIPLAITLPDVEFIGIDSVGKKLKAIDDFAEQLELKNIKTLNGRAEDIGQDLKYREQFDFVVSRATAYFPTLIEYAIPLLKVGGFFIAYKLDDKEELKTGKKALVRLNSKIFKVKNYTLAGQNRTLVIIEKIQKTHVKYPRKVGVPLASPIK